MQHQRFNLPVLPPTLRTGSYGSEELEVPSNSHAKTVPLGSGLLAQGTDKGGYANLAWEPRSSHHPQLDWGASLRHNQRWLFSLQHWLSPLREYRHSQRTKGQPGKEQPVLAVPVACKEQPALAVLPPLVQHPRTCLPDLGKTAVLTGSQSWEGAASAGCSSRALAVSFLSVPEQSSLAVHPGGI